MQKGLSRALRDLSLDNLLECELNAQDAFIVLTALEQALRGAPDTATPTQVWRRISKCVLHPDQPFALHKKLFQATYAEWDSGVFGPPPAWVPTTAGMACTNAARFMGSWQGDDTWRQLRTGDPAADWGLLQRLSFSNPEAFWPHMLRQLHIRFQTPPHRMLELHPDPDCCRWLPGARLNIAECALTGRDPDRPALVWAVEEAPHVLHTLTLGQLAARAAHIAAALRALGLAPGDAVAIDMPLTADAVACYLGIVLAGCAVVSIADSFVAREIGARCRIAHTKAIFTQDVILRGGKALPLYARVVEAGVPQAIVLPAQQGGQLAVELRPEDLPWQRFLDAVVPPAPGCLQPHSAEGGEVTNILFSSGTTGEPKAIPWTHITPLRCGADAFFHQDVRPGDVLCWPTNMGWMMGPWLVYAALLNSATIALFQGSPLGRPFGQFIERARVTMLGLVPSIAKAWRTTGCMKGVDWSCLRCFSSTGEASAPDEYLWLMARAGYKPVIEYCGGTEIGGGFLSGSPLQPQAPSTFSTPVIGHCPVILTERPDGTQALSPHGDVAVITGELAITAPCLGSSQRLLNKDHAHTYYQGMPVLPGGRWFLRRHGDEVERLPGGAYRAHGRVDDTMNLGGIKVSSVELERVCVENVEGVLEAAAVACPTPGGGPEQLHLFLVLRPGVTTPPAQLQQRCQQAISGKLNPLFKVHRVLLRRMLPRTASNKVMRRELRAELMHSQSKM